MCLDDHLERVLYHVQYVCRPCAVEVAGAVVLLIERTEVAALPCELRDELIVDELQSLELMLRQPSEDEEAQIVRDRQPFLLCRLGDLCLFCLRYADDSLSASTCSVGLCLAIFFSSPCILPL